MSVPYFGASVVFLTAVFIWELYLNCRQHKRFSVGSVPKELTNFVTQETYDRARCVCMCVCVHVCVCLWELVWNMLFHLYGMCQRACMSRCVCTLGLWVFFVDGYSLGCNSFVSSSGVSHDYAVWLYGCIRSNSRTLTTGIGLSFILYPSLHKTHMYTHWMYVSCLMEGKSFLF